ncbi:N-acetylmuramoyl-L-alanine amidase family protein (plasmid) [Mycolicibacterium aichiense]|uniref:N-acetylmuramoyl-L-alanine amidase family protein n=1 Tax=Mycolicibacterium aichiense TaxID=1799 RepID=UPI003D67CD1D
MVPPPAPSITTEPSSQRRDIAGTVVMLDPGLSGGDVSHERVPNGRGGTTNCQAVSSTTDDGFPDHTFNWDTTLLLRQMLTQLGVRTAMTRGNDNKAAVCDDERARNANTLSVHPDAIVTIGAYSGPPAQRGFVVTYSDPPLNDAQKGPALQLARTMQRLLTQAGLEAASQGGVIDGLAARSDLALLNLAEYPAIQVELGNVHNAEDAAMMSTPSGRQQYADALARGIAAYLSSR